ncbi:MAG: rod shape-determining protein RodA [Bacillota bacterium]
MLLRARELKQLEWVIVACFLLLSLLSLVMVASATRARSTRDYTVVKKQAVWVLLGTVIMLGVAFTPYEGLVEYAWWFYGANILLLGAVLVAGKSALGAQRWLQIGPVPLQPSELAKVFTILFTASNLTRSETSWRKWGDIAKPLVLIALPTLLIYKQPDLGTSLVLPATVLGITYMAGAPGGRIAAVVLSGIGTVAALIVLHFKYGVPLPFKDYQLKRIAVLFDPSIDPLGAGYHIRQSIIAIGSGKLWGKGLFMGDQSQLKFLPEPHTDFIFAVIGEELGFIGAATVLIIYLVLLIRVFQITLAAKDRFGCLVVAGVGCMLGFHVLVNAGMVMGIMPVVGIPLPFVSAGGSSFLSNSIALGLVQSVWVHRRKVPF